MNSAKDLLNGGVSPFGHPRINDRSHLPAAFRSVPRPSSPLGAKASTERPSLTHHQHQPNTRTQYQTAPKHQINANNKPTHSHTNITIHQIHLSKNCLDGEQVSTRGVSWKRPATGTKGPAQVSPMPGRPRAALAGHRERRAEPDDLAGSL
jgi:hypothetical protein